MVKPIRSFDKLRINHEQSRIGQQQDKKLSEEDRKFIAKLFYGLIGVVSSLTFFVVLYWVLRLDSAITNVITNTYDTPFYFWPYVVLTFGAIILFGVNVSLLVYRWRKFGFARRLGLRSRSRLAEAFGEAQVGEGGSFSGGGAASGLGSIVGIAASACPVCGSTLLSAIGIAPEVLRRFRWLGLSSKRCLSVFWRCRFG